jgi:hypothetical protein
MDWLKQLFAGLNAATDIFNLGRLVFYTAAGILVVYPTAAALSVLLDGSRITGWPMADLLGAMRDLPFGPTAFASIVVGFLIASCGFVGVIDPRLDREKGTKEDNESYASRYGQLSGNPKPDYDSWLTCEYFRFVELATYIPLGFLIGLLVVVIYLAAYVLIFVTMGCTQRLAALDWEFFALLMVFMVSGFLLWPFLWIPRVVEPLIRTYCKAQKSVIASLTRDTPKKPPAAPTKMLPRIADYLELLITGHKTQESVAEPLEGEQKKPPASCAQEKK